MASDMKYFLCFVLGAAVCFVTMTLWSHPGRDQSGNLTRLTQQREDLKQGATYTAREQDTNNPKYIQNMEQGNKELADYIAQSWIQPPSTNPRSLENPDKVHYSQRGQSKFVDDLLHQRTGGFYVESGAANGERLSNSLFFEKSRNWKGLLVEPNPDSFEQITAKNRKAFTINACLSPTTRPMVLDFRMAAAVGGLVNYMESTHKKRVVREHGEAAPVKVQCFPLMSILQALNVTHVDYFSLDIEGAELEVLRTIPFDQIDIDVLSIEYQISADPKGSKAKLENIKELLVNRYGYKVVRLDSSEDVILQKQ